MTVEPKIDYQGKPVKLLDKDISVRDRHRKDETDEKAFRDRRRPGSGEPGPHDLARWRCASAGPLPTYSAIPSRSHRIVIGKDTRLSGYMIESALTSGLCSMGIDVLLVGPVPTPGIAFLTRSLRADAGVVISASHNPYEDNGIKFFGTGRVQASRRDSKKRWRT